ncbi:ribosome-inactivating family protein, partial [Streptomyces sp. NPDC005799]|uniref:ribosome-inactivating family protein n=1 Tax=Streptomyces sp. NPDC005799 TaxID=3154678 RepID=UPI0033F28F04
MTNTERGLSRRSFLSAATAVAAASALAGGAVLAGAPRAGAATGANVEWRLTSDPADARATYAETIKGILSHTRAYQIAPRDGVRPVSITLQNGDDWYTALDVHAEDRPEFIRIFMRRSDAYIMGWRQGTENGVGDIAWGNFFTLEAAAYATLQDGTLNPARLPDSTASNTSRRHEGLSSYTELERQGGISRVGMQITPANLNESVLVLQDGLGSTVRDVARSLLRVIVAFAEGARFRDQAAATATAFGNGQPYTVTEQHAQQQNSWLDLSRQFFAWLSVNWRNNNVAYPMALVSLMMAHHSGQGDANRHRELDETATCYVSQDGFADHTTVQDAIDMAPAHGAGYRIVIDKGVYHEVSRRRESHPPPLSEPCGSLSAHTAPVAQPSG